jgi:hypothetical protein
MEGTSVNLSFAFDIAGQIYGYRTSCLRREIELLESVWMVLNFRYENSGRRSLVLVMFIGGVTFAEISALRFLNAQVCIEFRRKCTKKRVT